MGEPPVAGILAAGIGLAEAIARREPKRYILLGHSLGALVAFEAARAAYRTDMLPPSALVVCGRAAPHLSVPTSGIANSGLAEAQATLRQIPGMAELMQDAEMREIAERSMLEDLRILDTYAYSPGPPVPIPIFALMGSEEGSEMIDGANGWGIHTSAEFYLEIVAGDHFYPDRSPAAMASFVARVSALVFR